MRLRSFLPSLALTLVVAQPLSAQDRTPTTPIGNYETSLQAAAQPRPSGSTSSRIGWRAYFLYDVNVMAASETFKASFDTPTLNAPGFGFEVVNLWRGVFARVTYSSTAETGFRGYVLDDGEFVSTGVPIEFEMKPLEIGVGWRFRPMAQGRLVPYIGGGILRVGHTEFSELALADENIDRTESGYSVLGGIEARVAPWVIAGAEAQYRSIPDALGAGDSISAGYGETNLGGFTFRVLVGVGR